MSRLLPSAALLLTVIGLIGCKTAPELPWHAKEQARGTQLSELEQAAQEYVDRYGYPPSELGEFYELSDAQLAETLLRQSEAAAKAGPKSP